MENKVLEEIQVLIKQVFPPLLKQRSSSNAVRIWCPGCGTGEEALSLIINLLEYMQTAGQEVPIQLFGTDTDEDALKKARSGLYDPAALQNLTPQQLKRFFVKKGEQYQVTGAIRDMSIFAAHNLLTDPPFPRLDILFCGNSLTAFPANARQKILRSFHFALKGEGFLIVSPPDTIAGNRHFSPLPKAEQVYIRNPKGNTDQDYEQQLLSTSDANHSSGKNGLGLLDEMTSVDALSEKLLLSRFVPASFVINSYYKILRFHGPVHQYLYPSSGKATLSALNMLQEELAFGLQALMQRVEKDSKASRKKEVTFNREEAEVTVTIEIAPIQTVDNEKYYLVVFKEKGEPAFWEATNGMSLQPESPVQDWLPLQEQLNTLEEEYKTSREEWQAAHEELTANFEEAQYQKQALEQNNRELQAAVKELMLANEDLEAQSIRLSETSDLSVNVLEGIRDPLILLNLNLSVHAANRAFYGNFRLTPADVEGKFIYEIGNSQWNVPELLAKLSEVVSKKNSFATFEVPSTENRVHLFNAVHIETGSKRNDRILISMQDVTQYRQAREAKEWLAAVVQSSNEGIISFTTNKTIISWNKGAEEIFGYTEAEMVCKSITRLVRPNAKVGQHRLVERVMKGEIVRQLEMEHVHKDGRIIYVSTSIALMKDIKGNIKGLVASVQDITERKKAVEALRDSEERFRPIVSESSVGISRADFNGKLLFVNQKFCDMLGFTADELLGRTIWDITYANHIDRTKRLLKRLQEEGTPFEYEKQLIRKSGIPLWVTINLSAIKDTAGIPFSATAVIIDISQRKEVEEALHKTKESLQLAQEAANMGSWEIDLVTGTILYHSLRNDQILGYSAWQPDWSLDMARRNVLDEDKHLFDEAVDRMISKGRMNMEVRVKWPDGSIHWIYKLGQVFYDEEGQPYRAAGIGMDITDRKLAEQRKEALLGIASHELKTPVTSIKAYAQILQERFVEAEDYNSALLLTKLDRQVDKLTNLIKDLLDTTRITEGQLTFKQEIIDLNSLIQEVAEDIQPGNKSHRIIKKLQPLPAVLADKERIRQVLMNLLTNAVKYSPGADKIVIYSESDGRQVTVHVQDYGIGIPVKMQQQVFDRFFRAGNVKDSAMPGLGLGLFISAEIVRQHKGSIWVDSEEGSGSTFSFSLPVTDTGS